jgi:hypothetical protein
MTRREKLFIFFVAGITGSQTKRNMTMNARSAMNGNVNIVIKQGRSVVEIVNVIVSVSFICVIVVRPQMGV